MATSHPVRPATGCGQWPESGMDWHCYRVESCHSPPPLVGRDIPGADVHLDFPKPPDIQWTKAPDRVTQIRIPSRRDQLLRCRARSRRAAAVPKPVERLGVVSPAPGVARPAIEARGEQYFCLVDTPGTQRRVDQHLFE